MCGETDGTKLCNETNGAKLCGATNGAKLRVGAMEYDAVVVPSVLTLRSSTIRILCAFVARGGRVLFQGECPEYIDAVKVSGEAKKTDAKAAAKATAAAQLDDLYRAAEKIGADPEALLTALAPYQALDVRMPDGSRCERLLHMLRQDGDAFWLFVANGENPVSPDIDHAPKLRFTIPGLWTLTEYDTLRGAIRPLPAEHVGGATQFERRWHSHDSLLLKMEKADAVKENEAPEDREALKENQERKENQARKHAPLTSPETRFGTVEVKLSEPNMMLLDLAEWSLNGGAWQAEEEILRIDNQARDALGIVRRLKEVAQPYTIAKVEAKDRIRLRFTFESEIPVRGAHLALEDAAVSRIFVNGCEVPVNVDGWFVDHAIETVPLPEIVPGSNMVEVETPIGPNTDLEAYYLLGDFGVRVQGTEKTLTAPVRRVGFGDMTPQGLPFYTGNLDYTFEIETNGEDFTVRVPAYRGGLVEVLLDGESMGDIVFSPYTLRVAAPKGVHALTLRLFGTRMNGFGQLHLKPGEWIYQSPNSWRTAGDRWGYEYYFKEAGILKSPEIYAANNGVHVLQKNGRTRPGDQSAGISDQS